MIHYPKMHPFQRHHFTVDECMHSCHHLKLRYRICVTSQLVTYPLVINFL